MVAMLRTPVQSSLMRGVVVEAVLGTPVHRSLFGSMIVIALFRTPVESPLRLDNERLLGHHMLWALNHHRRILVDALEWIEVSN